MVIIVEELICYAESSALPAAAKSTFVIVDCPDSDNLVDSEK